MRTLWPVRNWLIDHIPFLTILILQWVALMPVRMPLFMDLNIGLAIDALFFWLIARPDLLSPAQVFLLGVHADCLSGSVFGVHTFCFMLLAFLMYTQRHLLVGRSFGLLWGVQSIVMLAFMLLEWSISSLMAWHLFPLGFLALRYLYMVGFYPIIAGLCGYCYDRFLDEAI